MYIHNEIIMAILPILEKSRVESEIHSEQPMSLQDFIGELNHAAWVLSTHNDEGLKMLKFDILNKSVFSIKSLARGF